MRKSLIVLSLLAVLIAGCSMDEHPSGDAATDDINNDIIELNWSYAVKDYYLPDAPADTTAVYSAYN